MSGRGRGLQIVRLPLGEGPTRVPVETLLRDAVPTRGVGTAPALPFVHALARTPTNAGAAHALYAALLDAVGGSADGYNLLVTRPWTLLVPRVRPSWEGIEVNALGFAGALLVRDRDGLERLRRHGPLPLLRRVSGVVGG